MKIIWPDTVKQARAYQEVLRNRVIIKPLKKEPRYKRSGYSRSFALLLSGSGASSGYICSCNLSFPVYIGLFIVQRGAWPGPGDQKTFHKTGCYPF
jgi:hypothetical protein